MAEHKQNISPDVKICEWSPLVQDWFHNKLDSGRINEVVAHLIQCEECRYTLEFTKNLNRLSRVAANVDVSPAHADESEAYIDRIPAYAGESTETKESFLESMAKIIGETKLILLDLVLTPFSMNGNGLLQPALRDGEDHKLLSYTGKHEGVPAFTLETRDNAPTRLNIEEPGSVVTFFDKDKTFIATYDIDEKAKSIDITSDVSIIVFNNQYCFLLNEAQTELESI